MQDVDVCVARQPIFDRQRQVYAYELLFRSGDGRNEFDGAEASSATAHVIANSLLSLGLENVAGGKKAFINFGRNMLVGGWHAVLPKETTVIEVLETVEPDSEVMAALQSLKEQGYTIALDDFVADPRFEALTRMANVIKVDMLTTPKPEQERLLRSYQSRGIEMVAEKVETYEQFDWARQAGYDYFQGYFFARPVLVRARQIPASKIAGLRLLQEMQRPELDFECLETLICGDVSFSYRLLRYINSALFHHRDEIHSIRQALVTLGELGIRRWVVMAALPQLAGDKPRELVTHSMVRARFCERLAQLAGMREHHEAFLMGLFSSLDALIDRPLNEALREVNLAPGINEALLGTAPDHHPLASIYRLMRRYEAADWTWARDCGVPAAAVGAAYLESTAWAGRILQGARS